MLYKRGKKYILHRIIKVRPNDYVIVGDHCIKKEYGITNDMILGIMIWVIRNGRSITPDNLWYRLYVHLWCDFFPIRVALLYLKRFARRAASKLKRMLLGEKPSQSSDEEE